MNGDLLTGEMLKSMLLNAAALLQQNKSAVDALNVFPVPDGDTGTNMSLTMLSATQEIGKIEQPTVTGVAKAMALGSLMGARGNSGVILSQLFRGIASGLEGHDSCGSTTLASALEAGVQTAYKAVMKPVEGTILTVAKEAARAAGARARLGHSVVDVWREAVRAAEVALAKTTEMLPVLKEAKVVDAGGKGLVLIFRGALDVLLGKTGAVHAEALEAVQAETSEPHDHADHVLTDIEFPYDTQLLIRGGGIAVEDLKEELSSLGDSLLAVGSPDLVRVHIHTLVPDRVLTVCLAYGSLSDVTIDDMREQQEQFVHSAVVQEPESEPEEIKPVGLVAVASGDGMIRVLKSLGTDYVIDGGQTMNPSTQDVVRAVKSVKAEKVVFLPNNSNIFLAAKQAKRVSGRRMYVVPTRTVLQGIAASLALNPDNTMRENLKRMAKAVKQVKSGEVTYAIRKSRYNGLRIQEGDILGIEDGSIVVTGDDPVQVLLGLLGKMVDEDDEIITVFVGNGLGPDTIQELQQRIGARFMNCDVEVREGGQPLYYFLVSVE